MTDKEMQDAMKKVADHFGSRESMLAQMIIHLSTFEQECDVTFYDRRPILGVTVSKAISAALMYGAGAKRLAQMFDKMEFSDGTTVSLAEIWTINPMPKGGPSKAELNDVDMALAEKSIGQNGETMREMIRATYKCVTRAEEDKFLRRFIAS